MTIMTKSHPILLFAIGILLSSCIVADDTPGSSSSSTCVFDDGQEYQAGDEVGDSFVTRCGDPSEWPCFCDPQLTFQALCPYCGFSDGAGTLFCARDGETISFQDGSVMRECSCTFDPQDPSGEPMRNCTVDGENIPVDPPSSGGGGSSGSGGPPTVVDGQCVLPDADGNMVEIDNGASFGDLIEGACGLPFEWPSYCRVLDDDGAFDISYPYCVYNDVSFEESSTGLLCAMDGEVISYMDSNDVQQTCNCTISDDDVPQPECNDEGPASSPSFMTPTSSPVFTPAPSPQAGACSIWIGVWTVGILQFLSSLLLLS